MLVIGGLFFHSVSPEQYDCSHTERVRYLVFYGYKIKHEFLRVFVNDALQVGIFARCIHPAFLHHATSISIAPKSRESISR